MIGVGELHGRPGERPCRRSRPPSRGPPRAAKAAPARLGQGDVRSRGRAACRPIAGPPASSTCLRLHVAHDHEHLVVGHVALVVEVDDRLVRRAVEHFEVADHRMPGRDGPCRPSGPAGRPSTCPRSTSSSASSRRTTFNSRANSVGSNVDVLHGVGHQFDGGHGVAWPGSR